MEHLDHLPESRLNTVCHANRELVLAFASRSAERRIRSQQQLARDLVGDSEFDAGVTLMHFVPLSALERRVLRDVAIVWRRRESVRQAGAGRENYRVVVERCDAFVVDPIGWAQTEHIAINRGAVAQIAETP